MSVTDPNALDVAEILGVAVRGSEIPFELLVQLIDCRISITVEIWNVGTNMTRHAGTVRSLRHDHTSMVNRMTHTTSTVLFDGNVSTSFTPDDRVTITLL